MFEFDQAKSASNAQKHGIDFEQVQLLWLDDGLVTFSTRDGDDAEKRRIAIGLIDGKFWSATFTIRGGAIRIISARRSRKSEIELYGREEL